MKPCEREGCGEPGRDYFITGGVVHAFVADTVVDVGTGREGSGWITLCAKHALADLGVAFG
jgi:hypothetical protein